MKKTEEDGGADGKGVEKEEEIPPPGGGDCGVLGSLEAVCQGGAPADRSARPAGAEKSKRRWAGWRTRRVIHAVHGRGSIHRVVPPACRPGFPRGGGISRYKMPCSRKEKNPDALTTT